MADKKGAKKASPDDIMAPSAMKSILAVAKKGDAPSCAIGMTKDKEGVILLNKRSKPKKLLSEMKKQAAAAGLELDMTSLRFGRAEVDADLDASLLIFTVNKDAPGALRPKLLESLKRAGFSKLEIVVDGGLENEAETDDDAAPAAPGATEAATADAPPAPAQSDAAPDAAALTATLTGLVRRMIGVIQADPTQADALKGLAAQAQGQIKAGDLAAASGTIDMLAQRLGNGGTQTGAAPAQATGAAAAPVNTAAFANARKAWIATRAKVESDIDKLHAGMVSAYQGHGFGADLDKFFRTTVEPVLGSLDESLAEKLDEVTSNKDPTQHAALVAQAKQIIQRYESYVASEPLIAKLDSNPFVPLGIEKTLTTTLSVLARSIA